MKKLAEKSIFESENVAGVRLFREDLDYILDTMRDVLPSIHIYSGRYEFDSLDELASTRGFTPGELRVSAKQEERLGSSMTITVKGSKIQMGSTFAEDLAATWQQLLKYVSSKVPWHYRWTSPWNPGVVALPLFWLAIIYVANRNTATPFVTWSARLFVASLCYLLFCLIWRKVGYGVSLRRGYEGTFLRRNGERLALVAIGAIIGAFFTWLFARLI